MIKLILSINNVQEEVEKESGKEEVKGEDDDDEDGWTDGVQHNLVFYWLTK